MIIDNTGQVGIGTNQPQEKLDVNGNLRLNGALMPAGNPGVTGQVLVSQGPGIPPSWQTPNYGDNWGSQTAVVDTPLIGTGVPTDPIRIIPGSSVGDIVVWDGNKWVVTQPSAGGISPLCSNPGINYVMKWTGSDICNSQIFDNGTSVGIGTTSPSPAAKLEISSNNSGVLIPRLTTAQRNNISSAPSGLLIYNSQCEVFQYYDMADSVWRTLIAYPFPKNKLSNPKDSVWYYFTGATSSTYQWIAPDSVSCYVKVKLWGAGGGSGGCDYCGGTGRAGKGGGGGYVEVTLFVMPKDTLTIYVAEGGKTGTTGGPAPGGAGGWGYSNGGTGGASGPSGGSGSGGGGGGATALFWNGQLIAVAGGGGGGGGLGNNIGECSGGDGGSAGQNGAKGAGLYSTAYGGAAGTSGSSTPANGTNGGNRSGDGGGGGGGGGGFSGGYGGSADTYYDDSGGGGGGGGASWVYTDFPVVDYKIINGNWDIPGNASDPSLNLHCPTCAAGGAGSRCPSSNGGDGFAIIYIDY